MSSPQSSHGRDLVFCHACENEWFRDEHGLVCPSCQGEFTEIVSNGNLYSLAALLTNLQIEQDHDPRAPDPDEDDIDFFNQSGPSRPSQPSTFPPNIFAAVGDIFGTLGAPGGYQHQQGGPQGRQQPSQSQPPGRQTSGPATGPRVQVSFNSGPGYSFSSRTTTYQSDGGFGHQHFHGGQQPDYGRYVTPARNQAARANTRSMMIDILGTIQGNRGSYGGAPGPDGFPRDFGPGGMGGLPINGLLTQLMGGIHGNPGDYVTNQEAFDRMLSQLMDEHATGSAPGPASADAIASLKRMPADSKTLGGDEADCSICMDEVLLGQEIIKLPCGHWYHPDCITLWLKEHDTCAICRKGIMPQSGDASTARQPTEAPMNDHDPAEVARRQSGTREDPIWVPESPSQARRSRPGSSRRSSSATGPRGAGASAQTGQSNEGGGFTRSFRNMFSSGSGATSGAGSGQGANDGRRGSSRK